MFPTKESHGVNLERTNSFVHCDNLCTCYIVRAIGKTDTHTLRDNYDQLGVTSPTSLMAY